MQPAIITAIATILGALRHQGRIDQADIDEITDMLELQASGRHDSEAEPLRALAKGIKAIPA